MRWKKYTIKTTSEAEDLVSAALYDLGIDSLEIEDSVPLTESDKKQMFVDILPDPPQNDGSAYLSFYLEDDADAEKLREKVDAVLSDLKSSFNIGDGSIAESYTEDRDWMNNWKQYFHQFYVDDILIIPSWEEVKPEDSDKMILRIDPGTAFGTGMHETTQLCLRQLKKYVNDQTELLDVGTGSGILSIASLKLGAKHAFGTDLDPCAIDAVYENLKANGIGGDRMDVLLGNIIDDEEIRKAVGYDKYDIVTANIIAEVLVDLTPQAVRHLKTGGIYITSGILLEKKSLVVEAMKDAGLTVIDVTDFNEWVCVTARKEKEG